MRSKPFTIRNILIFAGITVPVAVGKIRGEPWEFIGFVVASIVFFST